MTLADQIASDLEAIAKDTLRIEALSRTQPHVFAEQKDAVARRIQSMATKVRHTFGGAPARFEPGVITAERGRRVRVERRGRTV